MPLPWYPLYQFRCNHNRCFSTTSDIYISLWILLCIHHKLPPLCCFIHCHITAKVSIFQDFPTPFLQHQFFCLHFDTPLLHHCCPWYICAATSVSLFVYYFSSLVAFMYHQIIGKVSVFRTTYRGVLDLFQINMSTFSLRDLMLVHSNFVGRFSQKFLLFSHWNSLRHNSVFELFRGSIILETFLSFVD